MPNLKASNKLPSLKQAVGIRLAVGFGGLVLLALLGPLIWAAASAGVGLIVLGSIAAVGIGAFQAMPLVAQKWENKILTERKAEARKRPIEQLTHYLKQKSQSVKDFKGAVAEIGTQIRTMIDMVAGRKRDKPEWDSTLKEKSISEMTKAHEALVATYQEAEVALVKLTDKIDDQKFDWKFGEIGGIAIESLNALSGEDVVERMLADEAFDSVRDNFNRVFSNLDMEAAKLTATKSLKFGDDIIDVSSIQLSTKTLA